MAQNQILDALVCSHCTGEQEIPGLTDTTIPRRLGPKRASKIRKLFNLKKEDDVRQYVVRRPLSAKEGSLLSAELCSSDGMNMLLLSMSKSQLKGYLC